MYTHIIHVLMTLDYGYLLMIIRVYNYIIVYDVYTL